MKENMLMSELTLNEKESLNGGCINCCWDPNPFPFPGDDIWGPKYPGPFDPIIKIPTTY